MVDDTVRIPFSLDPSISIWTPEFNLPHRLKFWLAVIRPWLRERGYEMYEIDYDDTRLEWSASWPSDFRSEPEKSSPYAYYDRVPDPAQLLEIQSRSPPYAADVSGRVVYAQDEQHRHVAIKLVGSDSQEIEVLQVIFEKQKLFPDNIVPGIVPILDLLPFGGHWLVIMPRWGDAPMWPWFNTVCELLVYIRSVLQGLASLHGCRIAHQDLASRNVLINHFPIAQTPENSIRANLRRENRAKYALFDFDRSRIITLGTDRLSYKHAPIPIFEVSQRDDLRSGQYEFDPFACDVALLGLFLSEIFDHVTPLAPILAPLFDGMLTWQVEKRLTAQQALDFFDEMCSELTVAQLDCFPPPCDYALDPVDRWAGLPQDLVERWADMRTPPLPWRMKFLRFLCRWRIGAVIIRSIRRATDTVMSLFRS